MKKSAGLSLGSGSRLWCTTLGCLLSGDDPPDPDPDESREYDRDAGYVLALLFEDGNSACDKEASNVDDNDDRSCDDDEDEYADGGEAKDVAVLLLCAELPM
jgi:hypothetical protein